MRLRETRGTERKRDGAVSDKLRKSIKEDIMARFFREKR